MTIEPTVTIPYEGFRRADEFLQVTSADIEALKQGRQPSDSGYRILAARKALGLSNNTNRCSQVSLEDELSRLCEEQTMRGEV